MFKEVLQSIEGIEIFPVISLILFVGSFLLVIYAAARMSRAEVEYVSRLPLDESEICCHNRHADADCTGE